MTRKVSQYHTVEDLTGRRFGRYIVQKRIGYWISVSGRRSPLWECLCDCSTIKNVIGQHLKSGSTISCGCYHKDETRTRKLIHGESKSTGNTSEYRIYHAAKERCTSLYSKDYARYGGRGVKFLFTSFQHFLDTLGRRPSKKHSLDRRNNNGPYSPNNCRWATSVDQGRNRRDNVILTVNKRSLCIAEWTEIMNCHRGLIKSRHANGWCDECAVLQPLNGKCTHK